MKTIAIIDPFWSGHHTIYLELFSKVLLDLNCRVMVFSSKPSDVKGWIKVNSNINHIDFFEINEPGESLFPVKRLRLMINSLNRWRYAGEAVKSAVSRSGNMPDLVFFPWLDSYLGMYNSRHIIDRIFRFNWSGLYFHPSHFRGRQRLQFLRRGLLDPAEVLKSERCRAVAVLDEGVAEGLEKKLKNKKVIVFPDIADDTPQDREFPVVKEIVKKARGRKVITLLGSLAKRKGLLALLDVAKKSDTGKLFFVFAGRFIESTFTPDEAMLLKNLAVAPPDNCLFHFEWIPDEAKFNALVGISDILYAVYEDFPHSSNILTKAAIFEKPLIVSKGYCMDERVKAFNLGLSVSYGNISQCIEAIHYLCNGKDGSDKPMKPDYDGYKSLHSMDRLRDSFRKIIDAYEMP